MTYDYIIIGAGIVGLSTAFKISQKDPGATIAVLEKEHDVAQHQTGRNSGVIHSGIYYQPGSKKAENCVNGRHQLVEFCQTHGVAHDICGKVIVAADESEIPVLERIYQKGLQNRIEGISMINQAQLLDIEPYVSGVKAIHVPCAGIVDFKGVCKALKQLLLEQEHKLFFNHKVIKSRENGSSRIVETTDGTFKTNCLVNCAGLHSDRVARSSGVHPDLQIVPFRGEYYELTESASKKVNGLVYPLPNPEFPFLGVHFTRMVHGGVECGPNAVFAFKREGYDKLSFDFNDTLETVNFAGFWRMARQHWRMGLDEYYRSFSKKAFLKQLQKLIPSIREKDLVPSPSGVRAMALKPDGDILDDFFIERRENQIHVLNAPSPAATAGLAIGGEVAEQACG